MNAAVATDTGTILSVSNLTVRFGGVVAVDDISFEVPRGQIFSIIGPNGAGKTTLFNVISRIYKPTTGEVHYHGKQGTVVLTKTPAHRVAKLGIARTFQNIELFEHATVLQNLLVGAHVRINTRLWSEIFFTPRMRAIERDVRRRVEDVIDFLDLQHYRDKKVEGLPYGVRKVVELARALSNEPELILLDEPSSGLNVEETDDMGFWIDDIKNELGISVIMIEHDMGLMSRVSDRVLAMNMGQKLALGSAAEVQADETVATAYLGDEEVDL